MTFVNSFAQFKQGFLSGAGYGLGVRVSNFLNNAFFGFNIPFMNNFGCYCGGFPNYMQYTITPPSPYLTLDNYIYNQKYQNQCLWDMLPTQQPGITQTQANINCGWDSFEYSKNTFNNLTFSGNNSLPLNSLPYMSLKPDIIASKNTGKLSDYNSEKGNKLATIALNRACGFNKQCAKYVSDALEEAGLSNGERGHAYQMFNILRNNNNFKEISVSDVSVENLPAGCILVYDKGVKGASKDYGHVQVTTGDGRAVSDGITNNIKQPSAIFIPV